MKTTTRITASIAAALTGGVLLVPLAAAPAEAAVTGYRATVQYIGGGDYINERSAPNLSASVVRRVTPGTALSIECQDIGVRLGFSQYAENRTWDRLFDGSWVHDALTTTPGGPRTGVDGGGYAAWSANIPRCSPQPAAPAPAPAVASRESKAVEWAKSQLNVTYTNETPERVWSFWCETFAERAYGTTNRYQRAIWNYNARLAAGEIHRDTNPPAGALVFYSWRDYGHVGIAVGNGQVISTQSRDGYGNPRPVRIHGVTQIVGGELGYLGWAPAPSSWGSR